MYVKRKILTLVNTEYAKVAKSRSFLESKTFKPCNENGGNFLICLFSKVLKNI